MPRSPAPHPCRMVLIRWEKVRGLAIRPLTQTAPDETPEADQYPSLRRNPRSER
jgi:hypothetical protein